MFSTSRAFSLNTTDLWKATRTAILSLAAVILLATGQWATTYDFGPLSMLIVPVITGAVDLGRRWISDHSPPPVKP